MECQAGIEVPRMEMPEIDQLWPLLGIEILDGEDLPEPYRRLLAHERDMTSTLERFHGERLRLEVLVRRLDGENLLRRVVLVGERSGRAVELGGIRIELDDLSAEARERVLEGRRPLGAILAEMAVPYASRPRLFFRVEADVEMARAFGLDGPGAPLFGRRNALTHPSGALLAEVVEILPPP